MVIDKWHTKLINIQGEFGNKYHFIYNANKRITKLGPKFFSHLVFAMRHIRHYEEPHKNCLTHAIRCVEIGKNQMANKWNKHLLV